MARHMIPFSSTQDGDRDLIELAFSKTKVDDRKEWLRHFRVRLCFHLCDAARVQLIDCVCSRARISDTDEISYSNFINN